MIRWFLVFFCALNVLLAVLFGAVKQYDDGGRCIMFALACAFGVAVIDLLDSMFVADAGMATVHT